jgi:hypothetical protein
MVNPPGKGLRGNQLVIESCNMTGFQSSLHSTASKNHTMSRPRKSICLEPNCPGSSKCPACARIKKQRQRAITDIPPAEVVFTSQLIPVSPIEFVPDPVPVTVPETPAPVSSVPVTPVPVTPLRSGPCVVCSLRRVRPYNPPPRSFPVGPVLLCDDCASRFRRLLLLR